MSVRTSVFTILLAFPMFGSIVRSQDVLDQWGAQMAGKTWVGKQGNEVGAEHTYEWILGKSFLINYAENVTSPREINIFGRDPETKKYQMWRFAEDGTVQHTLLEANVDDKGTYLWRTSGNNNQITGTWKAHFKDSELHAEANIDGQVSKPIWASQPAKEGHDWIYSAAPAEIPESLKNFSAIMGANSVSGHDPQGRKIYGASVSRWILDANFCMYMASFVDENQTVSMHYFIVKADPEASEAKGWEFGNDGSVGQFTLTDGGAAVKGKAIQPDGSVFEFSGTGMMEGGAWIYSAMGQTEEQADLPYRWEYRSLDR